MSITNGYASLTEVKNALRIQDSVDDSLLEMAIESASRLIDGYAGRSFYNAGTATKDFVAQDLYLTYVDDLQSVSSLSTTDRVGGTYVTWGSSDYQLEPLNGTTEGMASPYTNIRAVGAYGFSFFNNQALVRITGVWGWPAVPVAIKQATIMQANRIFKRLDSPLGVAGFGDMGVVRVGARLDPDVQHLVDPYRKMKNFA